MYEGTNGVTFWGPGFSNTGERSCTASQATGAAGRYRRCEMSDERRQVAVAAGRHAHAFRCSVICRTARIPRSRAESRVSC
jgi:hypothetical protein